MAVSDTAPMDGPGYPASHYHVGQRVIIKKYGCPYVATVLAVGKTTLRVEFTDKGGRVHHFTFPGRQVSMYVREH